MIKRLSRIAILALCCGMVGTLHASLLIFVNDNTGSGLDITSSGPLTVSWTQQWRVVSWKITINHLVFDDPGGGSVDVELLRNGTPIDNDIISVATSGEGNFDVGFSTLQLDPGDYSLTLSSTSNLVSWRDGGTPPLDGPVFHTFGFPYGDSYVGYTLAGDAIPEPTTFVFVGAGILALGVQRWRRRRA